MPIASFPPVYHRRSGLKKPFASPRKAQYADYYEVNRDNEVEEPRDNEDQYPGNQGYDGLKRHMDVHGNLLTGDISRQPALDRGRRRTPPEKQRNDEENNENEEKDLRNPYGGASYSGETEYSGNDRHDQKDNRPV
jgi:hypothetical protein